MNPDVECPQAYMTAVELLVELASLQTAFLTLDEAIKTTNRRVNALDNVVIPKLENTIAYIKARRRAFARPRYPRRRRRAHACSPVACHGLDVCHGRNAARPASAVWTLPEWCARAAMCHPGQANAVPAGSPCTKPAAPRASPTLSGCARTRRPTLCTAARAPLLGPS